MTTSLDNFQQEFIPLAEEYGVGIAAGNDKVANAAHRRLTKLLRSTDPSTRQAVLPALCQHHCASVRLWAATYLLDLDEALASSTLAQCIQDRSAIGLTAEVTLDTWKSGSLKL
jgi:hypothetical protein